MECDPRLHLPDQYGEGVYEVVVGRGGSSLSRHTPVQCQDDGSKEYAAAGAGRPRDKTDDCPNSKGRRER